jgi:hypothetical protein
MSVADRTHVILSEVKDLKRRRGTEAGDPSPSTRLGMTGK